MNNRHLEPIHPGEILLEEFMQPMGITIAQLARAIGVSPQRIGDIVHGRRAVTADTALRLGYYFQVSPEIWTGLQGDFDLRTAKARHGAAIKAQIRPRAPA